MGRIVSSGIESAANLGIAAINSAATLGAAGMNKKAQEDYNKKYLQGVQETNQTNLDLAKQQNQWNKEQLADERAYNDPAKQVERLQGAGLSAAAASQSIEGAGNSGHIESAQLANQQAPEPLQAPQFDLNAIPSILGFMRNIMEMDKLKSESKIAEEEAKQKENETKWQPTMLLTDYDLKRSQYNLQYQKWLQTYQSFPYSLNALRYQSEAERRLPALRDQEIRERKAQIDMINANVARARQMFDWTDKLNAEEIKKLGAEIAKIHADAEKSRREADLTDTLNKNAKKTGEGIDLDNEIKDIQKVLAEHGSPSSSALQVGILVAHNKISSGLIDKALLGTKDYIQQGHKWFSSDPITRDFLYNVLDEGQSDVQGQGFWTQGAARRMFDSFKNHSDKYGQDINKLAAPYMK